MFCSGTTVPDFFFMLPPQTANLICIEQSILEHSSDRHCMMYPILTFTGKHRKIYFSAPPLYKIPMPLHPSSSPLFICYQNICFPVQIFTAASALPISILLCFVFIKKLWYLWLNRRDKPDCCFYVQHFGLLDSENIIALNFDV